MQRPPLTVVLIGLLVLGVALHGLTLALMNFDSARHFQFGLQLELLSCAPYALIALLMAFGMRRDWLFGGALAAFAVDVAGFLSVIVWPQDAQAPLLLLFLPFWTTVVALPLGVGIALLWQRLRKRP